MPAYPGRKDILETEDFESLHELALVEQDGMQYVRAVLKLDRGVKVFEAGEQPQFLALASGAGTRILAVQPYPTAPAGVLAEPVASEPTPPAPVAPAPEPVAPVVDTAALEAAVEKAVESVIGQPAIAPTEAAGATEPQAEAPKA